MPSDKRLLSKQDIEEITGFKEFDNIEDLEILFNNFSEISSLIGFPKLRRFACIDNGIQRISNLEPVSLTLQVLNLSDQDISKIENLNLPNLRELYLHRNYIRSVGSSSLSGCPRLQKLWLCQNQIATIDGLQGVPELQELWLQSNNITSLEGLACCPALSHLGLAGNSVSDFSEVRRLSSLPALASLSLQDIHFGRCPVTDEDGYKEFVACHLPRVQVLDGVEVSSDQVDDAHMLYAKEVRGVWGGGN
jgi:Leucine-rich repeat (LRR) protein